MSIEDCWLTSRPEWTTIVQGVIYAQPRDFAPAGVSPRRRGENPRITTCTFMHRVVAAGGLFRALSGGSSDPLLGIMLGGMSLLDVLV